MYSGAACATVSDQKLKASSKTASKFLRRVSHLQSRRAQLPTIHCTASEVRKVSIALSALEMQAISRRDSQLLFGIDESARRSATTVSNAPRCGPGDRRTWCDARSAEILQAQIVRTAPVEKHHAFRTEVQE